ncbi:cytochrome P450 [Lipomyces oligophaga]|uniref:cytochrome P450 n=1 Tax=Lipomyces oligophaga TaxID=45792 RepID=UPI0034CEDD61
MTKKLRVALAGAITSALFKYTSVRQWSLFRILLLWALVTLAPTLWSAFYTVAIYPFFSPYRNLPKPNEPVHWFFGNLISIQDDEVWPGSKRLEWMLSHPQAPWIVYYSAFQIERLLLCTVTAAQTVLMTKSYSFKKPALTKSVLEFMIGEGLLTIEGDVHRRQRKLLTPAFAFGHIKALVPTFEGVILRLAGNIAAGFDKGEKDKDGLVDIAIDPLLHQTTLDVIFQAGFGVDLNPIENEDHPIVQAYRTIFHIPAKISLLIRLKFVFTIFFGPGIIPNPRDRAIKRSKKVINDFCYELLREKRQKHEIAMKFGKEPSSIEYDLLNIMVKESNGLTDHEIIDNMATFLAAGHETTSNASTFAVYLLTKYPEIQVKLREEIRKFIPSYTLQGLRSGNNVLLPATFEVIESMKYLSNFSREVLRFMPPVPMTNREAVEDVMVDDLLIRKGTSIFVPIAPMNRLPSIWGPDADQFNPDRWNNLPETAVTPYAFETFLQGPRGCIGRRFAETEFKIILIGLVGIFELVEADPNREYKIKSGITSKFVNPLHVKVRYAP